MSSNHSKLVVDHPVINSLLKGGLTTGRFSYWTGMVNSFRTNTLLNLIVHTARTNRPPEGTTWSAMYVTGEGSLTQVIEMMARVIRNSCKNLPAPSEFDSTVEYVNHVFGLWGWSMSFQRYNAYSADTMEPAAEAGIPPSVMHRSMERIAQNGCVLRLLCIDTLELYVPRDRGFMDWLATLLAGVPDTAHVAVSRVAGQHTAWLKSVVADAFLHLSIMARTGYVPKFKEPLHPEHSIVHTLTSGLGRQFVFYRAANEFFDRGGANTHLVENAWGDPTNL